MKKSIYYIFLFVFFILLLSTDKKEKSKHEVYLSFLQQEQNALKFLNPTADELKMFTGVQYAALQNYYKTIDPQEMRVPMERLRPAFDLTLKKKSLLKHKSFTGLSTNWIELKSNAGGRTRAVMWDPNDTERKKVWAACVTGGLWFRNDIFDDNVEWQFVNDFWEGLSVSSLCYDPTNTQTFFAGTGEGQTARIIYRESSGRGFGILKSVDGGIAWEILESSKDFSYVTDMLVREEAGVGIIYAGVISGRYQSKIIGDQKEDGLYRSADGGNTWTQVLPEIPGTNHSYAPSDIELTSDGTLFVGTGIGLDGTGAGRILKSVDGINWTEISNWYNFDNSNPDLPGYVHADQHTISFRPGSTQDALIYNRRRCIPEQECR